MILSKAEWKKPQRIYLGTLFVPKYYSKEEALHKLKLFMDKWYGKDGYYICCNPFKRTDGEWCVYIQLNKYAFCCNRRDVIRND